MAVNLDNRARWLGKDGEYDYFDWEVYIDEPSDVLDRIDHVTYFLHDTFPDPIQTVSNRDDNFALRSQGWGEFTLRVVVVYKDGTSENERYRLDLSKPWDEQ